MTRRRGTSAGYVIEDGIDGCWLWTGAIMDNGYGVAWNLDRRAHVLAHRYVWELFRGPIPRGMHADHRCHRPDECAGGDTCPHRRCVNPAHIDLVTPRQNAAPARTSNPLAFRDGRCRRGHDVTAPGAIKIKPDGRRECRACINDRQRAARYAARKAPAA